MLDLLAHNIRKWRANGITDYHMHVYYMGSALNRVGDHDICWRDDSLWHKWKGSWREIEKGKDFWLFSVVGAFAWARDLIAEGDKGELDPSALLIEYDDRLGYVRQLKVNMGRRNLDNFSYEVKNLSPGLPPDLS